MFYSQDNISKQVNFSVLIECAHSSRDVVTRNHVFSLLSAVAKAFPEEVVEHILDIVAVAGESTITQVCQYMINAALKFGVLVNSFYLL